MDLESKLENQGFMERIKDKASSSYGKAMLGLGTLAMAGYASLFGLPGLQSTQPKPAYSYEIPDDSTLRKLMSQPVEETLQGTDYKEIKRNKQEIFNSDSPVMFFLYADSKYADNSGGQRGTAALATVLHNKFPQIKLFTYDIADKATITKSELHDIQKIYPEVKTLPSILWYDNDKGFIECEYSINGGINKLSTLKRFIGGYLEGIPKYILD